MDEWFKVLSATAAVFAVVLIGYGLRRGGLLTREADESMLRLVVRVLMPALILSVLLGNEAMETTSNLIVPPIVGFGTIALGVAVALVVAKWLGPTIGLKSAVQQRTFAVSVGMYNYGYIPIPLAEMLYDRQTLAVLFVHNVGVDVAMWTLCVAVLARRLGSDWWKGVLNPPLIAIVIAITLNLTGIGARLPVFFDRVIGMLGVCAIPIALIMIGATMADHFTRRDLKAGRRMMTVASLLRLGLLPVCFLLLAATLPINPELQRVMGLQAAMPAAVFPIVLARHYGGDVRTAVRVSLITSILGLVTIPLWLALQ